MSVIKQTPVGSLPRSEKLQSAYAEFSAGELSREKLNQLIEAEIKDVIQVYEKIEHNPILTTGEVEKPNFISYFLDDGFIKLGQPNPKDNEGFTIDFEGHHTRELAVLRKEHTPFKFKHYSDEWLGFTKKLTNKPFKGTVIAPSAVSLLYKEEIAGYSREQFLADAINEVVIDIQKCLAAGASEVGLDMTEATYALKADPSGALLKDFVGLIDRVAEKLNPQALDKVTLHTCFGADNFTNHNYSNFADVYPALLKSKIKNFHLPLASLGEGNFDAVLQVLKEHKNGKFVYLGFVSHLDKSVETPKRVAERILHATDVLGEAPGVSECCGYSPFCNDLTTTREWAFEKINTRVQGAKLAAEKLNLSLA